MCSVHTPSPLQLAFRRYVFRFEVLDKLLTGPTVLRPKLLPVVDAAVQKSALKSPIEIANAAAEAAAAGGPTSAPAAAAAAAAANSSTAMAPFSLPGGISESLLAHAASQVRVCGSQGFATS